MATRRERVILDLEDNFTSGIARAAVATRVLDEKLNHLGGTTRSTARDVDTGTKSVGRFGDGSNSAGPAIDKFSGRLKLLRDVALTLGPGLMPLGATAIPLLTAAMAGLGAAAGGIGVSVLALKGVGDALDSIDAYQLEPTTENLEAMRLEMEKMGPAGAHFVRFIDDLEPAMRELQMTARAGMLPGVEEGITALLDRLPMVRDIISELSQEMGELTSEAGAGLASDKWTPFFEYVRTEARPTLDDFAQSVGNVAEGVANMLVAFAPLTGDVTGGLEEMTAAFAEWSRGLGENDSFQEFLSYIQQNGPAAMDLLGALASAFGSFVAAAAPIGSVVLPVLTAFVKVIGAIADTPLGAAFLTAAVAITAYNRAAQLAAFTTGKLSAAMMKVNGRQVAAGIGLIALSMTDLDEKAGLSNTAMLGMAGLMAGPWGAAIGAGVGLTLDLAAANDSLKESIEAADAAISSGNVNDMLAQRKALVDEIDAQDVSGMNVNFGNALNFLKGGLNDVTGATDEGREAIGRINAAMGAGDKVTLFGDAVIYTGNAMRESRDAARQFSAALAELNGWFDKRAAVREYADSVKELGKGLKDGFTREDVENIDTAGRNILRVADLIKDKDLRADFLAEARAGFVKLAKNAAPEAAAAIQKVINKFDSEGLTANPDIDLTRFNGKMHGLLGDFDALDQKKAEPKVDLEVGNTLGILDAVKSAMTNLDGRVATTYVQTIRRTGANLGPLTEASGGYIRGPGTTTSDSIPALLSDREYVIRAKSVDKYGVAMMHAINAGQFAGGGQAGAQSGQDWSAVDGVVSGLMGLRRALRESERALAAETARRDELRAKAAEVSSGITSGLQSDIWAGPSNVWAAGAQRYNPIAALNMQRDRARRMIATINTLRAKGLTGAALAAILGEGLEAAEFMASQAPDMLGTYTAAYAESEAAVAQAAQLGGQATYGGAADKLEPGIRELNRSVKDLQRQLDRISGVHKGEGRKNAKDNADFVAAAINGAAKNGKQKAHR